MPIRIAAGAAPAMSDQTHRNENTPRWYALLRAWLLRLLLWSGLLLCAVVVSIQAPRAGMQWPDALKLMLRSLPLILVAWLFAVAAWREVVHAIVGVRMSWGRAIHQQGLLLIGKYVPGGVFGFLARVYDVEPAESGSRYFAAGLVEQFLAILLMSVTGLVLLGVSVFANAWLLVVIPFLPVLGAWGFWFVRRSARWLPDWRVLKPLSSLVTTRFPFKSMVLACSFMVAGALAWSTIACLLAMDFGIGLRAGVGVAGSFAVGVVAGMLVVIAPGGIGAREATFVALAAPWMGAADAVLLAVYLRLLSSGLDGIAGLAALLVSRRGGRASGNSQ